MSKEFVKVDPSDIKVYWVCNNKGCDDYGTQTIVPPTCNYKWNCESCDEVLEFDHAEIAKEIK